MERPGDLNRVAELLGEALELPRDQWAAWLDRACGEDPPLRAELDSLLTAASQAPGYLSRLREDVLGAAALEIAAEEEVLAPDPWPGRLLGPYRVLERIGRGGMATVYRGRDDKHARSVAIKVLRPELTATLATERFVREIRIAARLAHPHILPLFDSGESDGVLYYVMPYVDGESLRARLARSPILPVHEAVRLIAQVASALAYAHDRGVIHRDIKPENILLTEDQAIVADFGIAHAVEMARGERLTGTGRAIGTPAYMSPEQALATGQVDPRTDVYALGCVLYEMLAGRTPSTAATAGRPRRMERPVPRLRASNPSAPPHVDRAVQRALAEDPADRFPNATAFADALTTGSRVPRLPPRRWRPAGVVAGGGIALIVAAWSLIAAIADPGAQRIGVLPLTDLSGDSTQRYLVDGVHEALISELAQLGLPVIARSTMLRGAGADGSIGDIADELDLDVLIEGSIFRAGDSLEITARLYEAQGGRAIWTGSYDGDLPNVVALYRGIARAIAEQVRIELRPEDEARLDRAPAVNPEVYEAYLRGMYHLNHRVPDAVERALGYFEHALESNPADPRAYAGLALAYATIGHGPAPPPGAWQRARAAAQRAVRLDSTLADGWAALADVKTYFEWDWENAERAFLRANELNPSLPMNHYHYAWYLVLQGRVDEAIAEHRRAQELDPLTPLHTVWMPGIYLYAGRYRQALSEARKVAADYPENSTALFVLGTAAAQVGEYEEAIAAHERMVAIDSRFRFALGRTYALAGRTDAARRILAQLEAEEPSAWGAIGLADLNAALGNADEAFRWLAYEPAHGWLPWSRVNPALEPLRDDPRFQDLLRRLRLPPPGS